MGKIVLTCVLAVVFGFGGAVLCVTAFHDQFQGPQGQTGLTGAPGPAGADGSDGVDGTDGLDGARGVRGPRGKAGEPGKAADAPDAVATDLGSGGCMGRSVTVISSARIDAAGKLNLVKKDVCIVTPPASSTSATSTSSQ